MNRDTAYALIAALSLHAAVLFGVRSGGDARVFQEPEIRREIEVSLVIAAPSDVEPLPSVHPPSDSMPEPKEQASSEPPAPPPLENPEPVLLQPEPESQPRNVFQAEEPIPDATEPVEIVDHPEPIQTHDVIEPALPIIPTPSDPAPIASIEPVILPERPQPPVVHQGTVVPAPGVPSRGNETVIFQAQLRSRRAVDPGYPRLARQRGEEGEVHLFLWIDERGRVEEVAVKSSSGYPLLDAAATNAVKRSLFYPARLGNQPVPSVAEQTYHFRLRD